MMEVWQAIATSIGVIGLILFMLFLALRLFGTKIAAWIRSNREEKIGFSKSKLYNANGYLVSIAFAYIQHFFFRLLFSEQKKCVEILMKMENMLLQLYQFCLEPSAQCIQKEYGKWLKSRFRIDTPWDIERRSG